MNYLNHSTWLTDRKKYIGASDIFTLCPEYGIGFMTPLDLYLEKRGEKEREISEDLQNLFDAGHEQENITLYRFLKKHDPKIADSVQLAHLKKQNLPQDGSAHIFTEFKTDYMIAHPDLLWKDYNVELKFIRHKHSDWNFYYKKDGQEYGTAEDIPFKYWLQCQFQMMLTGKSKTILCANYQGADFYYFKFKAYKEKFPALRQKCIDFMRFVKNGTPPMPENKTDYKFLFPNSNKKSFTLPYETDDDKEFEIKTQIMKDRKITLKKKIKNFTAEVKKIDATVLASMLDFNVMYSHSGDKLAGISEWDQESVKSLTELKKIDAKKHKRVYNYLVKNDMIKVSQRSRFSF